MSVSRKLPGRSLRCGCRRVLLCGILSAAMISQARDAAANPVSDYLEGAEVQFDPESRRTVIMVALKDAINLPAEELARRRYPDYRGREGRWDLPTLIRRHFVPDGMDNLGTDFYYDIGSPEVRELLRQLLDGLQADHVRYIRRTWDGAGG